MNRQPLQCQTECRQPGSRLAAAAGPRTVVVAALLCALLSGCAGDQADALLSTDKPFPNLADVPPRPVTTPAAERQRQRDDLIRDRDAARAVRSAK